MPKTAEAFIRKYSKNIIAKWIRFYVRTSNCNLILNGKMYDF